VEPEPQGFFLRLVNSKHTTIFLVLSQPCYGQESYDPTVVFQTLYSHGWVISLEQQVPIQSY
jgi:hypothetical protein